MKDTFIQLVQEEKVDDIIPFLKSLTPEERNELVPTIKEYTINHSISNIGYIMLSIAQFVCFNLNDYKRHRIDISYLSSGFIKFHEYTQKDIMERISIDDILEWYQPYWMSKFINDKRTNRDLKDFTYDEVMRWYKKGYITPSPELIVATLYRHPFVFEMYKTPMHYVMRPEKLLEYRETLSGDIWLFFDYPSNINFNMFYGLENEDDNWNKIFRQLVAEGRLNRIWVLEECLRATVKQSFNKLQINWFVDLFNDLQPTTEELLTLQSKLFDSLTSPQSKAISNALGYIKKIYTEPTFLFDDFFLRIPILLESNTKAIVSSTIAIIELLLKKQPAHKDILCFVLTIGFISIDEGIQKKLAKLIVKYGERSVVAPQLIGYANQILSTVKPLLADFLEVPASSKEPQKKRQIPEMEVQSPAPLVSSANVIPHIATFDDFLFFAGQIFENNEPWHIFMLPVYIQQFHAELTSERIIQLEPIFKQAVKCIENWNARIGLIDRTFAAFFLSYGRLLNTQFPDASEYLQKLSQEGFLNMSNWRDKISNSELRPFYFVLLKVLDSIRSGNPYHLLSTPTHAPLWIDPVTLVHRLQAAQQQGQTPNGFDIQQAILRCALDATDEALQLAKEVLTGELRDLMVYLFEANAQPPLSVEHPAWWMCAALVKHPHTVPAQTELWGFGAIPQVYLTGNFEWTIAENNYGAMKLKLQLPTHQIESSPETKFLPEYYYSMLHSRFLWAGDVVRLLASAPYYSDTILAYYLNRILAYNTLDSGEKASLINGLHTLIDLRLPLSEMGYLQLAFCLFAPVKEIKDYAASLWTEQVQVGYLNHAHLGHKIAELLQVQWLPLKRFIDVIEINMLHTSTLHDRALKELLSVLLTELKDKPIRSLKKLSQVYKEL